MTKCKLKSTLGMGALLAVSSFLIASPVFASTALTGNLSMAMTVTNACQFTINGVSLNSNGLTAEQDDAQVTAVAVQCNPGVSYTIALSATGANYGLDTLKPGMRAMADGAGHFIAYDLFSDTAFTKAWNDTTGVVSAVSTGNVDSSFISAKVYDMNKVPQGTYTDTVVATVTYN